jgi:hypothetical protein
MDVRGWNYDEAAEFLMTGSERLVSKVDRAPFAAAKRKEAQTLLGKAQDLKGLAKQKALEGVRRLRQEADELMAGAHPLKDVAPNVRKQIAKRMAGYLEADKGVARMSRTDAFRSARASVLFDIDPVLAPTVVEFQKMFGNIIKDELQMGLAISHLKDPAVHYVTRTLTEEFQEYLSRNGRLKGFMDNYNSWYQKQTSTIKRKSIYEGFTTAEVNGFAKTHGKGFAGVMFELDPVKVGAARSKNLGRAARTTDFIEGVGRDFSRAADEVVDNPNWVPMDEIMLRHGVQPKRAAFAGGELIPTKLVGNQGRMIPAEIADAMDGVLKKWHDPFASSALARTLDESTRAWKTLVTAPFPAFHFRNHISNVWANHLGDVDLVGSYHFARKVMKDLRRGGNKVWDEFGGRTSLQIKQEMQAGGAWGFGQFGRSEVTRPGGLAARIPGVKLGLKTGEFIENYDKLAHYLDKLVKGYTPENAARSVKQFLFNYADLSPTEKALFKKLVPFYTWQRKNLPLQLQMMLQKPGKFSQLGHIQNAMIARDENGAMVDTSVVMPWERARLFGITGKGTVYSGLNVGSEELNVIDIARFGNYEQFVSMMNPHLKGLLQEVFNKDTFRGIPLDASEVAPAPLKIFESIPWIGPRFLKAIDFREKNDPQGDFMYYRANPRAMNAMNTLIPFLAAGQRFGSEATRMMNPRGDELRPEFGDSTFAQIGEHALSLRFLTGARTRPTEMQQAMFSTVRRFTDDLTRLLREQVREGVGFESKGGFGLRHDHPQSKSPVVRDLDLERKKQFEKTRLLLIEFEKLEAELHRAELLARKQREQRAR